MLKKHVHFIGIGGMGTRGFGRLELFYDGKIDAINRDNSLSA